MSADGIAAALEPTPRAAAPEGGRRALRAAASEPRQAAQGGARDLSEAEERALIGAFDGRLLSGPSHPIELSPPARDVVALLGDGRLLVNRDRRMNEAVPYVRAEAAELGIALGETLYCNGRTLVLVYEMAARQAREARLDEDFTDVEVYLKYLLFEGAKRKVSDVFITVERLETEVELNVHGQKQPLDSKTRDFGTKLLSRIYTACDDSPGGVFNPREFPAGRINGPKLPFEMPQSVESLRIQFLVLAAECMQCVLRFQHVGDEADVGDIDGLGYARFHLDALRRVRHAPFGMSIICGVTGSGKSTTLQRMLEALIRERAYAINVLTIEDPPEARIRGARQIPVVGAGEARDEGFARAIRAALRSAPNVIMIGEIRDLASGDLAVKAAQTGHQVWTTVHAISPSIALDRLVSEGIPEHRLLDPGVLNAVMAQRLIQALCPHCALGWAEAVGSRRFDPIPGFAARTAALFPLEYRHVLERHVRVRNEAGCSHPSCVRGYASRELIAELVVVDAAYLEAFRSGGSGAAHAHWLASGEGLMMVEHGFLKVMRGRIDPLDLYYGAGEIAASRMDLVFTYAEREGLLEYRDGHECAA